MQDLVKSAREHFDEPEACLAAAAQAGGAP